MAQRPLARRIVLNGYYGFDNFGDELILLSLIRLLHHFGFSVTVISQSPEITRQRYGVSAVGRFNLIQLLVTLWRSNGFISGGGGLLQDSTGPNSILYYGGMLALARTFGLVTIHGFTSIGPIEKPMMRRIASMALKCCQLVLVRDSRSATLVEELTRQRPLETADAVWLLPPVELTTPIPPNPMVDGKGNVWRIALSLRPHKRFSYPNQEALARVLADLITRATTQVRVELSMVSCEDEMDAPFLQDFEYLLKMNLAEKTLNRLMVKHVSQHQALVTLAASHWVMGMRYHAIVASLLNQRPVFALDYDPKVQALVENLGLPAQAVDDVMDLTVVRVLNSVVPEEEIDLTPLKKQVDLGFQAIRVLLEST
jgi:polysaccharide pyruvyl transferase CsaB